MVQETIQVRKGEELDLNKLENYLSQHIEGLPEEPLQIRQFQAGRSNLTYLLQKGNWEAVLRRPPLGPVAPKAHDMQREYFILNELYSSYSPAPKPLLFSDETLLGAPFFIMERKKGIVLDQDFPDHVEASEALCTRISDLMAKNLARLHEIPYEETKLPTITKPEGFMERQVHGWIGRYERVKTEEIPEVEALKKWMISSIPKSSAPAIIHYDFKLNNSMFDESFQNLVGVFDWEMTTVGDPLADLGVAMSYWIQEDDSDLLKKGLGDTPITTVKGFYSRDQFIQAYANYSNRDITNFHFYLTFAYFKLAVICQQIFYRWKKGQTEDARFANMNEFVTNLILYASESSAKSLK